MKSFTRITFLVLLMLWSSAVVFAQSNATNNEISELELQMMQNTTPNPVAGDEPVDFLATPVTSFPYFQDFEGGSIPPEFDISMTGVNAEVRISPTAAANGSNGLLFEGNTATGFGVTPTTWTAAFSSTYATHHGYAVITVVPDGSPGTLKMSFKYGQGYSYNTNYSWFIVGVDNGLWFNNPSNPSTPAFQATTHWTGSQWIDLEFDLSIWQGGGPFAIYLRTSMKYYENYYQEGDIALIDDFKIWYELPPGDLEGYVMNGQGLAVFLGPKYSFECLIQIGGEFITVAGLYTPLDSTLVNFHTEEGGSVHRGG